MTYRGDSKGGASVSLYPVTYISHLPHYVQLQHCAVVRTTTTTTTTLIAVLQYSTDGSIYVMTVAMTVAAAILRSVETPVTDCSMQSYAV